MTKLAENDDYKNQVIYLEREIEELESERAILRN
jgi:hypothetical protein